MPLDVDKYFEDEDSLESVRIDGVDDDTLKTSLATERMAESYGLSAALDAEDPVAFSQALGYNGSGESSFAKIQQRIDQRKEAERLARERFNESSQEKTRQNLEQSVENVPGIRSVVKLWTNIDRWASIPVQGAGNLFASGIAGAGEQIKMVADFAAETPAASQPGVPQLGQDRPDQDAKSPIADPVKAGIEKIRESIQNSNIELGIDPDKAATVTGEVLNVAGSLGGGFAVLAANPLAGAALFESAAFNEAVTEYDNNAKNPNSNDRLRFGLSYAIPSAAMDIAIGGEASLVKMLFRGNKSLRKELIGRYAASIPKEGITEAGQTELMKFLANDEFDQDREYFDGETLKSFLVGAAGAGVLGGVVSMPVIMNAKTTEILENNDFSPEAFDTISKTFTLEEFLEGETNEMARAVKEAAYNGDTGAQDFIMQNHMMNKEAQDAVDAPDSTALDESILLLEQGIEPVSLPDSVNEEVSPVPIRPGDTRDQREPVGGVRVPEGVEAREIPDGIKRVQETEKERRIKDVNTVKLAAKDAVRAVRKSMGEKVEKLREQLKDVKKESRQSLIDERLNTIEAAKQLRDMLNKLPREFRSKFNQGEFVNLATAKTVDSKIATLNRLEQKIEDIFEDNTKKFFKQKIDKSLTRIEKNKRLPKELIPVLKIREIGTKSLEESQNRVDELLSKEERTLEETEELHFHNVFGGILNDQESPTFTANQLELANAELEFIKRESKTRIKAREEAKIAKFQGVKQKGLRQLGFTSEEVIPTNAELKKSEKEAGWIKDIGLGIKSYVVDKNDAFEFVLENLSVQGDRFGGQFGEFVERTISAKERTETQDKADLIAFGEAMEPIMWPSSKNIPPRDIRRKFLEWGTVQSDTKIEIVQDGKMQEQPFSKWEAVSIWMQLKDQTIQSTFDKMLQIDPKWEDSKKQEVRSKFKKSVSEFIGNDGKRAADWLMQKYQEKGQTYQQTVMDVDGYLVGLVENYSPISRNTREAGSIVNIEDATNVNDWRVATEKNGSMKFRTSNTVELKFRSAFEVYSQHVYEMNHFVNHAELAQDFRAFFESGPVRRAIRARAGTDKMNTEILKTQLDSIYRGGIDHSKIDGWLSKAISRLAVSKIALNPVSAMKQWGSVPAYMDAMPSAQWLKYHGKMFLSPSEMRSAISTILDTEYMKNRKDSGQIVEIKNLLKQDSVDRVSGITGWRDKIMFMTRFGDFGAIIAGGWPVYKYNYDQAIAQGKTESEATKIADMAFSRATDRAQQSAKNFSLSYWQQSGSFGKLFLMYQTAPIQYQRNINSALLGLFTKDIDGKRKISPKQAFKTVMIYHVVLPQIFQAMGTAFIGLWDDETTEEWLAGQKRALFVGNLNSVFLIGQAIESFGRKISGEQTFTSSVPFLKEAEKAATAAADAYINFTDGESEEATMDLIEFAGRVSSFYGIPYEPVSKLTEAVATVDEKEYPWLSLMGFSDYALMQD